MEGFSVDGYFFDQIVDAPTLDHFIISTKCQDFLHGNSVAMRIHFLSFLVYTSSDKSDATTTDEIYQLRSSMSNFIKKFHNLSILILGAENVPQKTDLFQ